MTGTEMVTTFKIRQDWWITPFGQFEYKGEAVARCASCDMGEAVITHAVEMARVTDLIDALNIAITNANAPAEEYDFCDAPWWTYDQPDMKVPEKYAHLIAYAIEGGSEGYYVHAGAILKAVGNGQPTYIDFGFAKTYSADSAYALAREAQRFLTAAQWN